MYTSYEIEGFVLIVLRSVTDVYSWTVSPFNITNNASTVKPFAGTVKPIITSTVEQFTSIDGKHKTTKPHSNDKNEHSDDMQIANPWYTLAMVVAICSMTLILSLRYYWITKLRKQRYRDMSSRHHRTGDSRLSTVESHISLDDPPPSYEQCVAFTDPPPYDQLPPQYQMIASSRGGSQAAMNTFKTERLTPINAVPDTSR